MESETGRMTRVCVSLPPPTPPSTSTRKSPRGSWETVVGLNSRNQNDGGMRSTIGNEIAENKEQE